MSGVSCYICPCSWFLVPASWSESYADSPPKQAQTIDFWASTLSSSSPPPPPQSVLSPSSFPLILFLSLFWGPCSRGPWLSKRQGAQHMRHTCYFLYLKVSPSPLLVLATQHTRLAWVFRGGGRGRHEAGINFKCQLRPRSPWIFSCFYIYCYSSSFKIKQSKKNNKHDLKALDNEAGNTLMY